MVTAVKQGMGMKKLLVLNNKFRAKQGLDPVEEIDDPEILHSIALRRIHQRANTKGYQARNKALALQGDIGAARKLKWTDKRIKALELWISQGKIGEFEKVREDKSEAASGEEDEHEDEDPDLEMEMEMEEDTDIKLEMEEDHESEQLDELDELDELHDNIQVASPPIVAKTDIEEWITTPGQSPPAEDMMFASANYSSSSSYIADSAMAFSNVRSTSSGSPYGDYREMMQPPFQNDMTFFNGDPTGFINPRHLQDPGSQPRTLYPRNADGSSSFLQQDCHPGHLQGTYGAHGYYTAPKQLRYPEVENAQQAVVAAEQALVLARHNLDEIFQRQAVSPPATLAKTSRSSPWRQRS